MSGPYRPSDEAIGVIFLGALVGLVGGSILDGSPTFFILGMLTLFAVVHTIVKGGSDDSESKGPD